MSNFYFKQLLLFFLIFSSVLTAEGEQFDFLSKRKNFLALFPDFNLSLKRYGESTEAYKKYLEKNNSYKKNRYIFKFEAENLYNFHKNNLNEKKEEEKIPSIIHQIWIGSPLPEKYKELIHSWKNWDGWTHILWTDEEVKNLQLRNRSLYDDATNYGEKADILRLELLEQFGGLYVDIDFKCINPSFFQFAHKEYDFYIGLEPLECEPVSCCNALMSSTPYHPMITKMINQLDEHIRQLPIPSKVVMRSGPRYITKTISQNMHLMKNGIIFPPTFFYPIIRKEKEIYHVNQKRFIQPETAAIHFFDGNWRQKE